ncbi:hypothetical protein IH980_01025 [Patescibacteria group bacterium]|nr:hypothetical protein [Patescibacteria group bacterium]
MNKKRNILTGVIAGALIALVILMVFVVGIHLGRNQKYQRFLPFWEKRHAYRSFIPKRLNGHGVYGRIESLGEESMVVEEKDGALKTVLWDDKTRFRRNHTVSSAEELIEGETVIVLGQPSSEQDAVMALMVRILSKYEPTASPSAQLKKAL